MTEARTCEQLAQCCYPKAERPGVKLTAIINTPNPFNGPFSRTSQVSRYKKGKTNQQRQSTEGKQTVNILTELIMDIIRDMRYC